MYNQFKYVASWIKVKMNDRLGQKGAEMVEYAIVLACIAAVAAVWYSTSNDADANGLNGIISDLWKTVRNKMTGVVNKGTIQ